jgi:uncharacterized protein with PQ loop repeat
MKYLKRYNQYNEGWKSNLTKAGLVGSLLLTSPDVYSNTKNNSEIIQVDSEQKKIESDIKLLSKKRGEVCQDQEMNQILNEIQANINSQDTTKFIELFNKLNNHISVKYNYQITPQKIPTESEIDFNNLTIWDLLGWLGSILLASCGIPQAWKSFKEKNSDGMAWGFLLLWGFGEIFCLGYVYDKLDLPLLTNYAINILIVGVMFYYKINPTINNNDDTQKI